MRVLALLAAVLLAPAASAGVIDTRQEADPEVSETQSILQADVLGSVAAVNQKAYQARSQPKQWQKCNAYNTVYRREW